MAAVSFRPKFSHVIFVCLSSTCLPNTMPVLPPIRWREKDSHQGKWLKFYSRHNIRTRNKENTSDQCHLVTDGTSVRFASRSFRGQDVSEQNLFLRHSRDRMNEWRVNFQFTFICQRAKKYRETTDNPLRCNKL